MVPRVCTQRAFTSDGLGFISPEESLFDTDLLRAGFCSRANLELLRAGDGVAEGALAHPGLPDEENHLFVLLLLHVFDFFGNRVASAS